MLKYAPGLTVVLMVGPLLAGLLGTVLPAFGYLPALGGGQASLAAWRALFAQPGLLISVRLSATTGLLATAISFGVVMLFCAAWQGTRAFDLMQRVLAPILSVPHAAAAFGIAFLIAPSGWIVRVFAALGGWDRPADIVTVQDGWGLALVAGLVAKEVPFLFLMTLGALPQADGERTRHVALTLGYGRVAGWFKTVLPRIYPQIKLPVFAVLAYSASVVDVAMILAPTTPAPLAVRILHWLSDPDLSMRFMASAAALVQLGVVVGLIALWWGFEKLVARFGRGWAEAGGRYRCEGSVRALGAVAALIAAGMVLLGIAGLAVWSIAGFWRFPDMLPGQWSVKLWLRELPALGDDVINTVVIGGAAVVLAIILVVACLEREQRNAATSRPGRGALWLIYVPLLMPQISFMFGLQVFFTFLGLERTLVSVVLAHLVFVLPYVFLSLADPFRALDPRYRQTALCLGASPDRVFWRVILPLLTRPVLAAIAVGFAVSVGQYLPTLLIGAGRFATLTTDAVALAAGNDRRMIGIYGVLQTVLPFVGFGIAMLVPAILFCRRRGMRRDI
ncbi:ABC transporter permease [Thalassospira mesophila]|uniref:ABC transporter permease n=1 Tax=Thalassospira mesophila TaxID=1293891 RepID=A0A1Y2L368_9PROT|nr:ABC transporter permease [Thalassospira mesophila]